MMFHYLREVLTSTPEMTKYLEEKNWYLTFFFIYFSFSIVSLIEEGTVVLDTCFFRVNVLMNDPAKILAIQNMTRTTMLTVLLFPMCFLGTWQRKNLTFAPKMDDPAMSVKVLSLEASRFFLLFVLKAK